MNSRQRVLTVFAHEQPDRVPVWCGASEPFWEKAKAQLGVDDEALRVYLDDDFRRVFSHNPSLREVPEGATSVTPFGVPRTGLGYGQPITHPLAGATLNEIHSYAWPDPSRVDISHIRAEAVSYDGEYAILGGEWSPFWHDLIDLIGMEELFLRMYDAPESIDAICQYVVEYYAEVSRRTFEAAGDVIDIFFIGNDFGSQRGPLLDEEMFRRFLMPHLQYLVDLGHDYDLRVMMHCCGGIAELLPAMIDAGLDGIHALQPCCESMAPQRLKREFGERIVLNGGLDSHRVLIDGTPEMVREETRRLLEIMMPGGGYIGGASHDTILEETPLENVVAMFEAYQEFGVYP